MNERLLAQQLKQAETRLSSRFVSSIEWLRRQYRPAEIELAFAQNLGAALAEVGRAADMLASEWRAAYNTAAMATSTWMSSEVGRLVSFDVGHWRSLRSMGEAATDLRNIVQSQAEVVQFVLGQAAARPDIGRLLRDTLGLTPSGAGALIRYADALDRGDRRATAGALLSLAGNEPADGDTKPDLPLVMPARAKASAVERYRTRLLGRRAEVIGALEGRRAVHGAMYDAIHQAAEAGDLAQYRVVHVWHTRRDPLVRDSHDDMDGQIRYGDDPFRSGLGNLLRFPGDPLAPQRDTAGCRCRVDTRLLPISQALS